MKSLLSICIIAVVCAVPAAWSQDKSHPPDEPGPIHKELAKRAGEYNIVSKFALKPGESPMESTGTAKITSVVDGRFLLEEHTGMQFGKPIKGLRLHGYNNSTKQYESTWTYSMATGMMLMQGTSKDNGKTIDYAASFMDAKGDKQMLYVTTRFMDDDHFTVELYAKTADGKRGPALAATYTRKK